MYDTLNSKQTTKKDKLECGPLRMFLTFEKSL